MNVFYTKRDHTSRGYIRKLMKIDKINKIRRTLEIKSIKRAWDGDSSVKSMINLNIIMSQKS